MRVVNAFILVVGVCLWSFLICKTRRRLRIQRDFDRNNEAFFRAALNRNTTAMKSHHEQCEAALEELKKL
jgi:hypothetical protein